jgi:hypothetical protein
MVDFCKSYSLFMFVWPYVHSHIFCTQLMSFVVCHILFIFGILIDHDLSMHILYRFHGWLIFVRVIALFMFVWPYVCPHILCTQLVICLLSHFSDHSQPRYQLWIKCDKRQMTSCVHKMCGRTYGQTNMKRAITLTKINHPWNRYNMGIHGWFILCESYSPFHVCLTICPFADLVYAT